MILCKIRVSDSNTNNANRILMPELTGVGFCDIQCPKKQNVDDINESQRLDNELVRDPLRPLFILTMTRCLWGEL